MSRTMGLFLRKERRANNWLRLCVLGRRATLTEIKSGVNPIVSYQLLLGVFSNSSKDFFSLQYLTMISLKAWNIFFFSFALEKTVLQVKKLTF